MFVEEVTFLTARDNAKIALWKIYSEEKESQHHIFLTHGTFSDRKICLGLARHLVKQGYTCWIMEWRNHGNSHQYNKPFNFETVALYDIEAVFSYLINIEKITEIQCVTHSGGGICLTMFLLRNQNYIPNVTSIVMFSCQAFSAGKSLLNKSRIWISNQVCRLLSFVPGKYIGLGPENESYYIMKQWFYWNLNRNFLGNDNFDYKNVMDELTIPVFSICAAGDTMIAPPDACQDFLSAYENEKNRFLLCSQQNGFNSDYSHDAVIQSNLARKEIWPKVDEWLLMGGH